jgi:two-component system KDP operon response regulator KdpE
MKTILAIDDDAWFRETISEALAAQGYRVIVARSADEGMRKIRDERPDLVMIDVNMPGKNGFELYQEMGAMAELPVLFVSGASRSFSSRTPGFMPLWVQRFSAGTTDILYKPFRLGQLYDKVESLIGDASELSHDTTG